MTPEQFIERWRSAEGTERALSQTHFLELCDLLDVPKPPQGRDYAFEKAVKKPDGSQGYADVWKKGHFACSVRAKAAPCGRTEVRPHFFLEISDDASISALRRGGAGEAIYSCFPSTPEYTNG